MPIDHVLQMEKMVKEEMDGIIKEEMNEEEIDLAYRNLSTIPIDLIKKRACLKNLIIKLKLNDNQINEI